MDEDSDDDAPVAAPKQKQPEAPPMDLLDMGCSNPQPASNGFSDLLGGIGTSTAPQSQNQGNSLLDLGSGQNDLMNFGNAPAQTAPSSGFDFMQSNKPEQAAQVAPTTDLFSQLNMQSQPQQQSAPTQGFNPSPYGAAPAQSQFQAAQQPSFSAQPQNHNNQPSFAGTQQPSFGGLLDMQGSAQNQQQQQAAPINAFSFMQQQPPAAAPQQAQAPSSGGGNMFGSLTMGGATNEQPKQEEPPKKKDAFSMGANLINF